MKILIISLLLVSCGGKHYDCNNWGKYTKEELFEVLDYCKSDRMHQYNSCGVGKQRDWKTGACVNK